MSDFQPGELVKVTLPMVRIESINDVGVAQCSLPGHKWRPTINLRADGVEIDRLAPEQWPPRHGDMWRDRTGMLWAGMQVTTADDDPDDEPYAVLVPLASNLRAASRDPYDVLQERGPLALCYRQPEGVA